MPFRNAIARLALNDARRFENRVREQLQGILAASPDEATRRVVREILAEEEDHLTHIEETMPGVAPQPEPLPAEERVAMPAPPPMPAPTADVCRRLRDILDMEAASVTFYSLLAGRCRIPSVRAVFQHIADEEQQHVEKMRAHIQTVCPPDA